MERVFSGNDEMRDHIVGVASKIFAHFGFRKATMDEIASATRKGKSSIYYYFSSKEEIFKAVVEKEASELKRELHKEISRYDDPTDKLKSYILMRMKKLKKVTNFYSTLKSDYLSHLEFADRVRKKFDEEEIEVVRGILQGGVDNGNFELEDSYLGAVAIVTAMKGLEIPLIITDDNGNLEERLDNLIRFLFYGLIKRK
ncbi:MAG TPA: TetR/AcrR family transcriptional regulator [Bacteroidales bacterium]|nr:TetR/AcrR family transcriptional regulator [Bacteroidales bacterium]